MKPALGDGRVLPPPPPPPNPGAAAAAHVPFTCWLKRTVSTASEPSDCLLPVATTHAPVVMLATLPVRVWVNTVLPAYVTVVSPALLLTFKVLPLICTSCPATPR